MVSQSVMFFRIAPTHSPSARFEQSPRCINDWEGISLLSLIVEHFVNGGIDPRNVGVYIDILPMSLWSFEDLMKDGDMRMTSNRLIPPVPS